MKYRNVAIVGVAIVVVGVAAYLDVRITAGHRVTADGYSFVLPKTAVLFGQDQVVTADISAGDSASQFTLLPYPGTESSPMFYAHRVRLSDTSPTSDPSYTAYLNRIISSQYTPGATRTERTVHGHTWTVICSGAQPAIRCSAETALSGVEALEFTYDVRHTTAAATSFSHAFADTLGAFRLTGN